MQGIKADLPSVGLGRRDRLWSHVRSRCMDLLWNYSQGNIVAQSSNVGAFGIIISPKWTLGVTTRNCTALASKQGAGVRRNMPLIPLLLMLYRNTQ